MAEGLSDSFSDDDILESLVDDGLDSKANSRSEVPPRPSIKPTEPAKDTPQEPPEALLVTFRNCSTGKTVPDRVLTGEYDRKGENHGRPVYVKRDRATETAAKVHLYFWDSGIAEEDDEEAAETGDDLGGWWFGSEVGGEDVWAQHSLATMSPPETGWRVVSGGNASLQLIVAPSRPPYVAPSRKPPERLQHDGSSIWHVPQPWVRVSDNGSTYFWNEEFKFSSWSVPPGCWEEKVDDRVDERKPQEDSALLEKPPGFWGCADIETAGTPQASSSSSRLALQDISRQSPSQRADGDVDSLRCSGTTSSIDGLHADVSKEVRAEKLAHPRSRSRHRQRSSGDRLPPLEKLPRRSTSRQQAQEQQLVLWQSRSSPPRRSVPRRSMPRRGSPLRGSLSNRSPPRSMPRRSSPLRGSLSHRSPARRSPPRRSPPRRSSPRRSLPQRSPPRSPPRRRSLPQRSPPRSLARRSPPRRSVPRRSPPQTLARRMPERQRPSPRRSPPRRSVPRRSSPPRMSSPRRSMPRASPMRRSSPLRRSPLRHARDSLRQGSPPRRRSPSRRSPYRDARVPPIGSPPAPASLANQPCRYFSLPGGCKRGDECFYSHSQVVAHVGRAPSNEFSKDSSPRGQSPPPWRAPRENDLPSRSLPEMTQPRSRSRQRQMQLSPPSLRSPEILPPWRADKPRSPPRDRPRSPPREPNVARSSPVRSVQLVESSPQNSTQSCSTRQRHARSRSGSREHRISLRPADNAKNVADLQAKLDDELALYMGRDKAETPQKEPRSRSRSRTKGDNCLTLRRASPRRRWEEPLTKQPPGRQVHLPGVVRSDEGLQRWLQEDGYEHLDRLGPAPLDCIDVSHNNLTDDGTNRLLEFFLARKQPTRRLKLFHNRLREPQALCDLLEDPICGVGSHDGIGELHLSHNNLSVRMLEQILKALARAVDAAGGSLRTPFWLRLEHNERLKNDASHLTQARSLHGLRLCAPRDLKKSGCNVRQCKHGADVHLITEIRPE